MKNLFKYASLLMAAAMLFSCEGTVDPDGPTPGPEPEPEKLELKIASDRNLVQTGVDEATITVTLGEEVITKDVTFFDGNNKQAPRIQSQQVQISRPGFSSQSLQL